MNKIGFCWGLCTGLLFLTACHKDGASSGEEVERYVPRGQVIQFSTPDSKGGQGYAMLTSDPSAKYLVLFHEWWGLNDQIKKEAERLYDSLGQKVNVLAPDMYGGKLASSEKEAGRLKAGLTKFRGEAIVNGVFGYAGPKAEYVSMGWGLGGNWALRMGVLGNHQVIGVVMYYGVADQNVEEFNPLEAAVLGIFGKKDKWVTPELAGRLDTLAKITRKQVETHQFHAAHAFANPSSPKYNRKAAEEANALALAFIRKKFNP